MDEFDRTPRDKPAIKRQLISQMIDQRIARPIHAVDLGTVKGWFPDHEKGLAMTALMELLEEETPVTYAVPAVSVWLEDIKRAQDHLKTLVQNYPQWFEE